MDQLTYNYTSGKNQLRNVTDAVASGSFPDDFDSQTAGIYIYDGAGNITSSPNDTSLIAWTPYGKVDNVTRSHLNQQVKYGYDAAQNRVLKAFINTSTSDTTSTYYIRDAQGNVMAVYEVEEDTVTWREQHLYGSARLGIFEPGVRWYPSSGTPTSPYFAADSAWYLGCKLYEIGNHLGNVVSVISDRKQAFDTDMDDEADYYEPVVLSATDYYPFGFEMPGRKYNIGKYRYEFNGKEADRNGEFSKLVHDDYGFRVYNRALGRFLSADPLESRFPWYSPYQFSGNSPIANIDLDGLEPYNINTGGEVIKSSVEADNVPEVTGTRIPKGAGLFYTDQDLSKRDQIFATNNPLKRAIINLEQKGDFRPIYDPGAGKVVAGGGYSQYAEDVSNISGGLLAIGFSPIIAPVAVELAFGGGSNLTSLTIQGGRSIASSGFAKYLGTYYATFGARDFGNAAWDIFKESTITGAVQVDDVAYNFLPIPDKRFKDFMKNSLGGLVDFSVTKRETGGLVFDYSSADINGIYFGKMFADAARTTLLDNTFGRYGGKNTGVLHKTLDLLLDYQIDTAFDSYDKYYNNERKQ